MDSHQTFQPNSAGVNSGTDWAAETPKPSTLAEQQSAVEQQSDEIPSEASKPEPFHVLLWFRLLWEHPLVFWSGIWAILLLIMGIAVSVLMNPYLSKQEQPDRPIARQPNVVANDDDGTLPMWALGTIALSCAAGSMLISQRFKHTQQERRSLQSKTAPLTYRSNAGTPETVTEPALFTEAIAATELSSASNGSSVNSATLAPADASSIPSVVTVVPADERNPLDWEDAGLAELMDIRYRRHR